MKTTWICLIAIAAFAPAMWAADAPPTPEGKLYTPGAFDRLEVDGSGMVRLSQSDRDEVFITGDDRAQESAEVRLQGNRMRISLAGGWKFWNNGNVQVDVRMRNVHGVTLSGAGQIVASGPVRTSQLNVDIGGAGLIRFDDLVADQVGFDISGAGEGQLAGKVDRLDLSVSGKGKITADKLRVGTANVAISGVGNGVLWVSDTLSVDISGAGHIDYRGQPVLKKSISGFGSVSAIGERK